MVKAIFFDIDGTLRSFRTHKIPQKTLEALHSLREKAIKLFIATGRHKSNVTFMNDFFEFDACITLNGQYCFNSSGVIHKQSIDKKDLEIVVNQAKQQMYSCYFVEEDEMYVNMIDDKISNLCREVKIELPKVCDPERALGAEIYQLNAYLDKEDEHIIFDLTSNVKPARWHKIFTDIIPLSGGKQSGIEAVLRHYGIPLADTMAFGDGENDISMLKYVKTGIAMGNANDTVKNASDYVTDDIDNDGIGKALRHFEVL